MWTCFVCLSCGVSKFTPQVVQENVLEGYRWCLRQYQQSYKKEDGLDYFHLGRNSFRGTTPIKWICVIILLFFPIGKEAVGKDNWFKKWEAITSTFIPHISWRHLPKYTVKDLIQKHPDNNETYCYHPDLGKRMMHCNIIPSHPPKYTYIQIMHSSPQSLAFNSPFWGATILQFKGPLDDSHYTENSLLPPGGHLDSCRIDLVALPLLPFLLSYLVVERASIGTGCFWYSVVGLHDSLGRMLG